MDDGGPLTDLEKKLACHKNHHKGGPTRARVNDYHALSDFNIAKARFGPGHGENVSLKA